MDPQATNLTVLPLIRGQEVSFGTINNPFDMWDLYTDTSAFPPGVVAEARLYATSAGGQRYLAGILQVASGSSTTINGGVVIGARATFILDPKNDNQFVEPLDSRSGGVSWELRIVGISPQSQGAVLGAVLVGYSYSAPQADESVPLAPVALLPNFFTTSVATIVNQHQFHDASVDFAAIGNKPTRWELFVLTHAVGPKILARVVSKDFPANFSNKVETIFQAITNVGAVAYILSGTDLSGTGVPAVTVSLEGYDPEGPAHDSSQNLTQDVWHVNATTGSDSNDGLTALTALQTLEQLTQVRWGKGAQLEPTSADRTVQIFIDSNIPPTDPLNLDVVLGSDVTLIFRGTAFTTIFAGALTASTALNRVANQAQTITDAAAPWAANTGQRIRNTTVGPSLNSISYIARDFGAGVARISRPWLTLAVGNIPVFLTTGAFAALDTYVIESLPTMTVANVNVQALAGSSQIQFPALDFWDLDLEGGNSGLNTFMAFNMGASTSQNFFACRVDGIEIQGGTPSVYNGSFKESIYRTDGVAGAATFGGLILNPNGFFFGGGIGASMIYTFDVMVQSNLLQIVGIVLMDDLAVFDSATDAIQTNAVLPFLYAESIPFFGTGSLYGDGSAGAGFHMGSNASFIYASAATLTITGTRDFDCGAVGPLVTPDPATNTNTAAVAQLWVNIPVARAAGFGGTVINPSNQARILPFFP